MKRIVYTSRATAPMSENELVVLLVQSRENNARDGITGVLLYAEGMFLQLIEGPAYSIDDLLGRLELDARHRDFRIIQEGRADGRLFADWTMGFREVSAADVARVLQRAAVDVPEGAPTGEDGRALDLLERLARGA